MSDTDTDDETIAISLPQIILIILCVSFIISAGIAGVSSARPLGIYNTDWSGSSDFRSIAGEDERKVILRPSTEMTLTEQTVFIIFGVSQQSMNTRQSARAVLRNGGTVVILDGVSVHANRFLKSTGADARVGDRPLRDLESYYRSPSLPIINSRNMMLQNRSIDEFTVNHAASIKRNGATVIATSSNISYVDQNRNDEVDESESSVFTNTMLDREGNQKLARALLDPYDQVIIGGYNTSILPTISTVILLLRRSVGYQAIALGGLFISAISLHSLLLYYNDTEMTAGKSEDDGGASVERMLASGNDTDALISGRVSLMLDRHPSWDKERIQRLIKSSMDRDGQIASERDDDE